MPATITIRIRMIPEPLIASECMFPHLRQSIKA
jgi:hypothetical protein